MTLAAGTRLGAYEVLALIGAGGMGEVYRARDTKLGRDVAIKVVSDGFGHDPERMARFEREAHMLAALNHPHIAAIYGLEESGGSQFLVMELVEGETLADRIDARGFRLRASGFGPAGPSGRRGPRHRAPGRRRRFRPRTRRGSSTAISNRPTSP